jgi:hypothetical protein
LEETELKSNGHDPLSASASIDAIVEEKQKGAIINLSDLKRGDGILTRSAPAYQSLLHRALTAISDNQEYRQELKSALWASGVDEADDAVAALNECACLGMDPTPIVDQIIARSAGKAHELLYRTLETLTHSTFTTNYQGNKDGNKRAGSPIGGS